MILSPPPRAGWQPLAGGSWLFHGARFHDDRGTSEEIYDFSCWPPQMDRFTVVQENVVTTQSAGTARGLHYQIPPYDQAKLVTVLRGRAQFFWLSIVNDAPAAEINSIILTADAGSLFTPGNCAHGMLSLVDDTQFLLKMSAPISMAHRGEISMHAKSLSIDLASPIRDELLSERDRHAPGWNFRRSVEA